MRTPHVPIPAPPPHSTPPISPHFTLPTHYPHPLPPTHPLRLAPGPPTASPPTTAAAPPAPTCRLETNKLRNTAKLFAHLLATDSIPWAVLQVRGWACRRECAARPVFHPAMPWLCTAQHSMRRVVTSQAPLQGRRRRMGGRAVLPCGPLVHVACLPPPPPPDVKCLVVGVAAPSRCRAVAIKCLQPLANPSPAHLLSHLSSGHATDRGGHHLLLPYLHQDPLPRAGGDAGPGVAQPPAQRPHLPGEFPLAAALPHSRGSACGPACLAWPSCRPAGA